MPEPEASYHQCESRSCSAKGPGHMEDTTRYGLGGAVSWERWSFRESSRWSYLCNPVWWWFHYGVAGSAHWDVEGLKREIMYNTDISVWERSSPQALTPRTQCLPVSPWFPPSSRSRSGAQSEQVHSAHWKSKKIGKVHWKSLLLDTASLRGDCSFWLSLLQLQSPSHLAAWNLVPHVFASSYLLPFQVD